MSKKGRTTKGASTPSRTRTTKGSQPPDRREAAAWLNSFRNEPHKHPMMLRLAQDPAAFKAAKVLEGALSASGQGPRLHLPSEHLPLILP